MEGRAGASVLIWVCVRPVPGAAGREVWLEWREQRRLAGDRIRRRWMCVCVCEITLAFVRSLALSLIETGRYWRVPIREKHHVTWGFTELVWWLCGE